MSPARPATRFVVVRYNWRPADGTWYRLPGQTRLASFATATEAHDDLARRDEAVRRRLNPFCCGRDLADRTSLPEPVLLDFVQDLGLPLPDEQQKGRAWADWWDRANPSLVQRLALWERMDQLRFYDTVERPNMPVGYAIVSLEWQYNDEYNYLNAEGGEVQRIYRTREKAMAVANKRRSHDVGAAGAWAPADLDLLDAEAVWHFFSDGRPGYDIVEIELEGLT
jgi:hypothetical protein